MLSEYRDLEHGPAYLKPSFEKLKSLMPRFHVVTKGLDACIDDHEQGHYSKANLSDLFEYLSEEQTEGFMRTLATGMRKGGSLRIGISWSIDNALKSSPMFLRT